MTERNECSSARDQPKKTTVEAKGSVGTERLVNIVDRRLEKEKPTNIRAEHYLSSKVEPEADVSGEPRTR